MTFTSLASNLVPSDGNNATDVFLRDTCIGSGAGCMPQTIRVSVDSNGVEPNDASDLSTLSANGRYVAFSSNASTLLATPDANGTSDIFLRDTCFTATNCTPSTVHVTWAGSFAGATDPMTFWSPLALSYDGRIAAWAADQPGIVPNDTNARRDVFLSNTGL